MNEPQVQLTCRGRYTRALVGACFVLLSNVSLYAGAAGIPLGDLSPGDSATFSSSQHTSFISFDKDRYDFGLTTDNSNVSVDLFNVDEFALQNGGGIVYLSGRVAGQAGAGTSFTVNDLDAGDYTLFVKSVALGVAGGGTFGYDGMVSVATIPLPAAAWLFGSALAGLLVAGRRRAAK